METLCLGVEGCKIKIANFSQNYVFCRELMVCECILTVYESVYIIYLCVCVP